jgi:hypothetical protein
MPITIQPNYHYTRIMLDPRIDGKEEWDQVACTWLTQYVNFNLACPWDNDNKAAMGSELLGAGEPLQKRVAKWKNTNVRKVWFKFYTNREWELEIGASYGANSSTMEYRVLDIANQSIGVDDDGNPKPIGCGQAPAPAPKVLSSPAPGGAAPIIPAPVQPQQVAKLISDANNSSSRKRTRAIQP